MAKKVKVEDKKELKGKLIEEEIEEDVLDFEEYDDEDEVVVSPKKEKHQAPKKEVTKVEKTTHEEKECSCGSGCCCETIKPFTIATFIISLISLILCVAILTKLNDTGVTTKKSSSSEEGTETTEYDTSMFTEIDAEEFVKLIKNKNEYSFVYTGRPSCSYCQMMIGNYIQSIEEYDYKLYYFDTENVTSDIIAEIQGYDEVFEQDFPSTPMVYLVGNYGVKDVNEGYTEYSTYASFLEDNGVHKK